LSTISATVGDFATLRVGGVAVTGGGGGAASPTNVPAFSVTLNGGTQAYAANTQTKIQFTTETFDTYNSFDAVTNHRFRPTVAGYYQINLTLACSTTCYAWISKNSLTAEEVTGGSSGANDLSVAAGIFYLNGTTDYIEGYVHSGLSGSILPGPARHAVMSGSLLASGNGLISGSTALGDRIVGSNANVVAGGGMVSISTGGVTGTAYFDTAGRLVAPGVSVTGVVSATRFVGQFVGDGSGLTNLPTAMPLELIVQLFLYRCPQVIRRLEAAKLLEQFGGQLRKLKLFDVHDGEFERHFFAAKGLDGRLA
jgi:hypothetical protein